MCQSSGGNVRRDLYSKWIHSYRFNNLFLCTNHTEFYLVTTLHHYVIFRPSDAFY